MVKNPLIEISEAGTNDLLLVKELFLEYAQSLDFDLCFQNFDEELNGLPGLYAAPAGCILLAHHNSELAGCVALKAIDKNISEMKRLYVRPKFQGLGIGKALTQEILKKAKDLGYAKIRLDTVPAMKTAITMYKSMGFYEIEPYRENPIAGALYLEKNLINIFSIRNAEPADAKAIATININCWKKTYKGIVADDFLNSLSVEPRISTIEKRTERADLDCLVAVSNTNEVIGFADFGPCREKAIDADAELYAIYVDGNHHGLGAGKSLFIKGYELTKKRGYKKMMVSVFSENKNARAFYEKMGGTLDRPDKVILNGIIYPTVTYVWNI
jgi:ribosomal protein S18 acetylase RimI-like enzyme